MEMIEQLLALTEDRTVRMALALAAVVLLILVVAFIIRRFNNRGPSTRRGRVARLAILEAISVDQRRRLVLLRRDNTEHLVLIGGPTDLVVEEGIHRQARPTSNARPASDRAEVPRVPIGARSSEPATKSHLVPPPSVGAASPVPIVPASIAAGSTLAQSSARAPESPNPVVTPAVETKKDPQMEEMERKLMDALKPPAQADVDDETVSEKPASDEIDVEDIDLSLETAIADAVASEAAPESSPPSGDEEAVSLTERLNNIEVEKSPSG